MHRLALLLCLFLLPAASAARPPAFELLPLGAGGGGIEADMSCFALRPAGTREFRVLLDGGSLTEGIARHLGTRDFARIEGFFLGIEDVLFTHSHLDHLAGFLAMSPSLFARPEPMRIHGSEATLRALQDHVFNDQIWGDMVRAKRIVPRPAAIGEPFRVGPFRVTALRLEHPVPSVGYQIEDAAGEAYVHLGDTGPTDGDVDALRRLLRRGKLRALAIECSFPDEQRELALMTRHLTPSLLVHHLHHVATGRPPEGEAPPSPAEVAEVTRAFRGVRILVHHVKPKGAAAIRAQLAGYRARDVPLEQLYRGRLVRF